MVVTELLPNLDSITFKSFILFVVTALLFILISVTAESLILEVITSLSLITLLSTALSANLGLVTHLLASNSVVIVPGINKPVAENLDQELSANLYSSPCSSLIALKVPTGMPS